MGKLRAAAAVICISLLIFCQQAFALDSSSQTDKDITYLKNMIEMIKEKYGGSVTDSQLIDGALKGMFGTMDKYTTFYSPDDGKAFISSVEGKFDGIGVVLTYLGEYTTILKVFPGSPAEKAGILPGDRIAAVDGKSVKGLSMDNTVSMIKGIAGTMVKISVLMEDDTTLKDLKVTRAPISVNPVTYEIRGNIGYIKLDTFNVNADKYMTRAFDAMDAAGIKKIILDLRNNPGGRFIYPFIKRGKP